MAVVRPTKEELQSAYGKTVADVIAPDLRVLFCGINPGLYTAAVGHHFARPGNRFWPALHQSGFTPRLLAPAEERQLLPLGLGITNVVDRATAAAEELSRQDYHSGGQRLAEKVRTFRPRYVAVLGLGAYRVAFDAPRAIIGIQPTPIGITQVWVLPNPSGLNAHYQLADLVAQFGSLRAAVDRD